MLRFRLLGAFEAYRGDDRISPAAWRTRNARTVLEILLDQRRRAVPFERLADLVWPETDPAAARNSLQVAVGTIRRVLEPDLRAGSSSRYLRTEGGAYRFIGEGCEVDVDEFARERERALAAERAGDRDRAIAGCRAALALYRGDYLADDPVAEWPLAMREHLRESVLDLIERLSRALIATGRTDEAIAAAERGVAIDPLREELYQAAMRAHLAAGRRSHALAVYERCRRVLLAEIGVEPSDATRTLRASASATAAWPRAAVPAPSLRPRIDVPFVGRTSELATLRDAWERAGRDSGVVALVHGPAGVGKTRLARELADALGPQVRTLWMTAHEAEQGLSFAPTVTLLAGWLDRSAGIGQLQRLGPHAPVLAHLLPRVREVWPDCPPPPLSPPDPTQILEALTRAVGTLSGAERSLLVLDDAHWADDATALWVGYLTRRLPAGTLLLLTRRSGEHASRALDAGIAEWRKADRLADIALGPLSRADLEHVVALVSDGAASSAAVAARIHAATEGYPLFAVEILRELWRRGELGAAAAGELPVPTTVRDTVALRTGRLEPDARDMLAALAVVGVPASTDVLAAVADQDRRTTLASLEQLLEHELARTTEDGRRYTVEHPLVARVVYDGLHVPRRAAWHRRAAAVLNEREGELGPVAPGQVLRHLVAAGAGDEELAAAAERVGERALDRHLYAEAVGAFELARDRLAALVPDAEVSARRSRAVEHLGDALNGAARWDDAMACYREVLETTGGALARSRLRRKMARILGDVPARFAEALGLLDEAEGDLSGGATAEARTELGRVEAARTLVHFLRSEYAAVLVHGERALALWGNEANAARDTIDLLQRMGGAKQRVGDLAAAERSFALARARSRSLGDRLLEARSEEQLGLVALLRGDLGQARALVARALGTYREMAVPKLVGQGLINLGWVLTHLGELQAALAAYEEALASAAVLEARYTTMHALVGLGETLLRIGDLSGARKALERGDAIAQEIGNRQRHAHALMYLAAVGHAEGHTGEARVLAQRAIAEGGEISDALAVREGPLVLCRALLALGDATGAAAAARAGLARAVEAGFVLGEARGRLALAEVLWARGDAAGARHELDAAIATFRAAPARYDLALALFVRGTTVLGATRRGADAALSEALTLARDCAARPLAQRIAAFQRDLSGGAQPARRDAGDPHPPAIARGRRVAQARRHRARGR